MKFMVYWNPNEFYGVPLESYDLYHFFPFFYALKEQFGKELYGVSLESKCNSWCTTGILMKFMVYWNPNEFYGMPHES